MDRVKEDVRADNMMEALQSALAGVPNGDFAAAQDLLTALGYRSARTLLGQTGDVADFIAQFPAEKSCTVSEQTFRDNAQSVRIIFQVTGDEVATAAQRTLFDADDFDSGNAHSFLFVAVELKGEKYPRGQYAQFTREINKRFPMPTVVLFRTTTDHHLPAETSAQAGLLTLAFVHRREHRHDKQRDVLGKVSLIREIDTGNPHRAHLDILAELSLDKRLRWMKSRGEKTNFDGLLAAWLAALDTEELNKRFYRDLFTWFEKAVSEATFPENGAKTLPAEEHVIRLITRLLFVWFIKEKGLIAPELFIEKQIGPLLRDYNRNTGDSYYRAVLQNLFFATLNTEIDRRGFSKESNTSHRDFSLYRYRSEIRDPDALLALFDRTPFINGGLFDCLDSEEATRDGGYRIDCFTDNPNQRKEYSIPNPLFFDPSEKAPGLITLFERYKFTVEENTPIEQEVALDPELLGKVFENLLAAYNPETRVTARKQTGSYYTPRAVVDYMVDEALKRYLEQEVAQAFPHSVPLPERLDRLLSYTDEPPRFTEAETDALIRAIAEIKVLDPAVGSGAFPMGVLHKLTLALQRTDPDNKRWEELQKERAKVKADAAFETKEQQERDAELLEISETFERYRDSDFGRKLYLIQNSIFGVDIQPVACQIAKLRFFISLAIEQEPSGDAGDNYGIKPLPNLETRFVAANTLLRLRQTDQMSLGEIDAVKRLERELNANRERHFHATTRQKKLACRNEDRTLRRKLATELENLGFPADTARKIAKWDPYDQNTGTDWFDAQYMFYVAGGFDVVIGNPPYIQLQKNRGELSKLYKDAGYATFAGTGDIYQLFCERGCRLLTPGLGLLAFITSNSWLKAEYGKPLRRYFAERHTPLRLLEMGKDVFDNTIVDTSVLLVREGCGSEPFPSVDMDKLSAKDFPPNECSWGEMRPEGEAQWSTLSAIEHSIMGKMRGAGTPIKEWDVTIYRGVTTGCNDAFVVDNATKQELFATDPSSAEIIKPVLRGKDIKRYRAQWQGWWLITSFPSRGLDINNYPSAKEHLLSFGRDRLEQNGKELADGRKSRKKTKYLWFELQDTCAYHEEFAKEKLFWRRVTRKAKFAYVGEEMQCINAGFMLNGNSLKYLCAVLNSELISWYM